ncbi:alpha-ketoglutarate-dependent taurine dioxygenase [Bradyrhizobium sp. USDA 3686]|uniref:TauD/TfdA dioxygenase family protein n=1 Tax=Bradyrhizobium canariense TaxID=255045 RepID=UPI00195EDA8B|nr:TauD/TfdA family dioxygenase [Bradyrhizobium canariense]MBM7487938.1 taurine dioxygenase [Bradyrhizobium canariense]
MSSTTNIANVMPSVDVIRHAIRLGAEVRNIRLSGDLSEDVLQAIGRLLLEHKVIFLRDQQHLDDAEEERLSVEVGRLIPSPQIAVTDRTPSILQPSSSHNGGADQGRSDIFSDDLRNISVLRAVMTTPYCGETVWSNTAAAYLDLPLSLRMLADELWAVYTNAHHYGLKEHSAEADEMEFEEAFTGTIYETTLPVVRTHPRTGERTLTLGRFAQRFVGLQKHTAQKLLDLFQSYIWAPQNTVLWRWREGDVAIWDKRLAQLANDHSTAGDRGGRGLAFRPGLTRVKGQKPR